jgi:hypothetical protein
MEEKNNSPVPSIGFENMDWAVFNYFDKKYPLIIDSRKVSVVFATPERWVQIQRDQYLKDENGQLILPVISIRRGNPDINRSRYVPKRPETNILIRPAVKSTSIDENANEPLFRNDKIYSIAYPRFITMNYSVTIWTSYWLDINEIQQRYLWEGIDHIFEHERFWFTGTIQSISESSNMDDFSKQEKIQKVEYSITLEGYISDNRSITELSPINSVDVDVFIPDPPKPTEYNFSTAPDTLPVLI